MRCTEDKECYMGVPRAFLLRAQTPWIPVSERMSNDSSSIEILFRNLTVLAVFTIMLLFMFCNVFHFLSLSYIIIYLCQCFEHIFKHVRNRESFHFVFFSLVTFCFSTFFYAIELCLNLLRSAAGWQADIHDSVLILWLLSSEDC